MTREVIIDIENSKDNDLISRQAAINAAIDGADKWDGGFNRERETYTRRSRKIAIRNTTAEAEHQGIG